VSEGVSHLCAVQIHHLEHGPCGVLSGVHDLEGVSNGSGAHGRKDLLLSSTGASERVSE
jgi:hypothetical protein